MDPIGKTLREARESLGLTLEEVERATRIRAVRLEALENEDFESLPSKVQVQGFLRNYADFLGLDPAAIVQRYVEGDPPIRKGAAGILRPAKVKKTASTSPSPRRFRIYSDQVITLAVGLAVVTLLLWGTNRILITVNQTADTATPEVITSTPIPRAMPTSTTILLGGEDPPLEAATKTEPTITPTLPLGLVDVIELEVFAEQSAFLQVLVDGSEEFQGRLLIGERLTFRGEERVEIVTGNARGIRIYFNGLDQGLMGQVNQVLTRVWTIRGMQTPTPTQTLTSTASPPVTETPTPTSTVATPGAG